MFGGDPSAAQLSERCSEQFHKIERLQADLKEEREKVKKLEQERDEAVKSRETYKEAADHLYAIVEIFTNAMNRKKDKKAENMSNGLDLKNRQ